MNNKIRNVFKKSLLAVSIASVSSMSQAGSFGLIENSASGQGSAFAGASALGEDASTVYFNPAAMTRLSGSQMVVAGHVILPDAEFKNNGSTDALGGTLTGANSTTDSIGVVPNFYYVTELENDVYFGVGVTVPFGLATDYDEGWVGRYHALLSEITSININPSIAWKATSKVSVGFGLSIQYMELELSNNLDSALVCSALAGQLGGAGPGCGTLSPNTATTDSKVTLDGDSLEIGWNAGVLIDINDKNRVGISYRSAIKHNVKGDAKYDLDPTLQAETDFFTGATGFNIVQDTSLTAVAELPETFSISYVSEIDSQWTVLADWTWTSWSNLDVITINQKGGVPGQESVLDLAYANTNRYSVGVNYQYDNKLVYRAGVALDETPIRSTEQTTARIPGNDRTWLSFGAGYDLSSTWTIDVGYSHLFISDTDINSNTGSSSSGATLVGTYESTVDIFSVQANYNF
ncbi:Long-chain fatty acid transport protein [hydrothermal vent metagenome]|uniref:Long-chain fatty acid transport protein n=1 Tax=hydrothermal vent metagenome TaxID=652676 RepID=A0A3B0WLX9_9ZZZZ